MQKNTSPEEQLYESILRFMDDNKTQLAINACQQLNQQFPGYANGWYLGSVIALKHGNVEIALIYIKRALGITPENHVWQLHEAHCLLVSGNITDAKSRVELLTNCCLNSFSFQAELGELLTELQNYPAALVAYERALKLQSDQSACHFNKAAIHRFLGEFERAEDECNKAIELDPHDCEVYLMRSEVRKQTVDNNYVRELLDLLASRKWPWRSQMHLCFSLAKEYEDLGEFTESFAYLKQGADLRRSHMQYKVSGDEQTIDQIIRVYGKQKIEKPTEGNSSNEPIFIVGLPRTGTTLVERILASHSEVKSAGELNNFAQQLIQQVNQNTKAKNKIDLVEKTTDLDFAQLGTDYIQSTRPLTGQTPYFIDKLPLNFLYIGLINLALPNAKVVHVTRNPMDTCFAIYKRLFKNAYPFSYDLTDIGRYYLAYHRLMEHWNKVMPGKIYNISYEALVADIESETASLLKHCGLSWQEECLRFYENKTASTTASAVQVRAPVYTSSIGNWKNYAEPLQPLQRMFEEASIFIGGSSA